MEKNQLILSVKDLNIKFNLRGKVLHAIRGIDLDIYHGEVLAIVGESGSGKSVFTKSFMGLLDANGSITSGTIDYYGADDGKPIRLSDLKKEKDWLKVRGHEIAMIMQDPMTSLNPLKTIGDQIMEAVELHQHLKGKAAREKTLEYLRDVGIADPEVRFAQYPHEFSGGMRQRVVIAIAVACNPQILICDEPTTALDVTIQAQILQLLKEMQIKYNLTIVLITHDLGVVANIADRVAVMYAGDIVEIGTSDEIYYDPRHPYTWALLSSMPQMGIKGEDLFNIQGTPPEPVHRDPRRCLCAPQPPGAEDRLCQAPALLCGQPHPQGQDLAAGPPGSQGGAACRRQTVERGGDAGCLKIVTFAFAKQRTPQWSVRAKKRSCASKMERLRPGRSCLRSRTSR